MIKLKTLSRYRAASIHFAISVGLGVLVLSIMYLLWYPPPLFTAMGGVKLITLIVGVDIIIGPLITLIIFDTRKKELARDLTIIAALQLAALGYGIHTMHIARPVFTVFTETGFVVVSASEINPEELAKARFEEFRHLSLSGPLLVATEPPTNPDELSNIAFATLFGSGIQHYPKYFVPYSKKRESILKFSRPLSKLASEGKDRERLEEYLKHYSLKAQNLHFLPLSAKSSTLTAIIDTDGNLMKVLDIPPDLISN